MTKFAVLTSLNPNAINAKYGRPAADCDVVRQADLRDVIEADTLEAAQTALPARLEFDHMGYPERIGHHIAG